jgi:glycosyltransferase involved in cell wall biosynthesis
VLTTFGLLGPGKGLEQVIEALPAILERHPETVYRILGATHPVLLSRDGESYREGLIVRAQALGVADHIIWENRFLDTDELLDQLEACDIYITPTPIWGSRPRARSAMRWPWARRWFPHAMSMRANCWPMGWDA